jgi:hypothetical protein
MQARLGPIEVGLAQGMRLSLDAFVNDKALQRMLAALIKTCVMAPQGKVAIAVAALNTMIRAAKQLSVRAG